MDIPMLLAVCAAIAAGWVAFIWLQADRERRLGMTRRPPVCERRRSEQRIPFPVRSVNSWGLGSHYLLLSCRRCGAVQDWRGKLVNYTPPPAPRTVHPVMDITPQPTSPTAAPTEADDRFKLTANGYHETSHA
jgi:hypothetical protein